MATLVTICVLPIFYPIFWVDDQSSKAETVTLLFEKVTDELAAMVPQQRAGMPTAQRAPFRPHTGQALMVDLSFQARGEAEFLKEVIEVLGTLMTGCVSIQRFR